jgi:hypothetical protein
MAKSRLPYRGCVSFERSDPVKKYYSSMGLVALAAGWIVFVYLLPLTEFPGITSGGVTIAETPSSGQPVTLTLATTGASR